MENIRITQRVAAEALGTATLLAAVVGSGIMGESLAGGNVAIALLANMAATGAALLCLILTFGSISGAHFNPAVSLAAALDRAMPWREVPAYVTAQVLGAYAGVVCAHVMFGQSIVQLSSHPRNGLAQLVSECVATMGLIFVIRGVSRSRPDMVPMAVSAYIMSAYWFTASTSFANPAVTLARGFTDTFAGIRPHDIAGFVVAQLAGTLVAVFSSRWLFPQEKV